MSNAANPQLVPLADIVETYRNQTNTSPVYNSDLLPLIREYKALWRKNADQPAINACFRSILEGLLKTLLVVPFNYDKEHEFANDRTLHFSSRAAVRFNLDSIACRAEQMTIEEQFNLSWVVENGLPTADMSWWDIRRFGGSEGYTFADPSVTHGRMYPCTGSNANGSFMLVYTGIDQLMSSPLGKNFTGHIGIYTLDEVVTLAMSVQQIKGFIINPDTDTHCFVDKAVFTRS